jgi:hypothetical protein
MLVVVELGVTDIDHGPAVHANPIRANDARPAGAGACGSVERSD